MISASECFHSATLELVRSTPIKQRLICAYRKHLANLTAEQVPTEVLAQFEQITRSLHGVKPLPGEDAVAATVRKMSSQQADDCAELIVRVFESLCRAPLLVRQTATVVQLPLGLHRNERLSADFDTPLAAVN